MIYWGGAQLYLNLNVCFFWGGGMKVKLNIGGGTGPPPRPWFCGLIFFFLHMDSIEVDRHA